MTLSIITINYNNCDGLQKTIDSVLAQTWTDFEWIVIDGGSTDGSRELIEQYQEHFAYWCSEPDRGVYHAMNKGIAKAQGEYINFMNAGDAFFEAGTLKHVFTEERDADILYGDCLQVFRHDTKIVYYPQFMELYALYGQMICHQTMMIRSSLLKGTGYNESFKICADYKHLMEVAMQGATFFHVGCIVCRYDMTGMSSKRDSLFQQEWDSVHQPLPILVRRSMDHLNGYAGSRHTVRARILLERGGFVTLLTKVILACLDKIFIRYDFTKYPYCD